jgi:hypothetical protein
MNHAKYRCLEITSPSDNSTINIRTTNLEIEANVVPPVRNDLGHVLQIMLDDGVLVENETSYMVGNVRYGTHTIQLRIIDEDENIVKESEIITVHIK